MHRLRQQGIGCGFLEPQPQILHYGLLEKLSEGLILEKIIAQLAKGEMK